VETVASAAKDTVTLVVRLAVAEAHTTEGSATAERHFGDFYMKLARDLAPLREAYEHNV
jgi:hypothetical protein